MSNAFALFRALVIYGICLPLAIFLGYLLATPQDTMNLLIIGVVLLSLTIPLFLRWHHPLLVLAWNLPAVAFFLPGRPAIFLPVCAISFGISILQFTLNRKLRFINVPALTWPLVTLAVVVLLTAEMTGGVGLRFTGGMSYGGKRYVFLLMGIAGYFAMTAKPILTERVTLYVRMYFLSVLTSPIGYLSSVVGSSFYFIFLLFPGDPLGFESVSNEVVGDMGGQLVRLGGLTAAGTGIVSCMLALSGIRGVCDLRKPWRIVLFTACVCLSTFGGFRSALITILITLIVQFYLEGLMRSRLLPVVLVAAVFGAVVLLPFTDKLPLPVQRAMSFLPVKIDPVAEMNARGSTEWRLQIWQRVLPEIPDHLLLGKGYSMNGAEIESMADPAFRRTIFDPYEGSILSGDYHSGPLSVIVAFGIWGTLAFLWFLYAATKALYQNYANGDPQFKNINTYLLTAFIAKTISFFLIFGSLYSDMVGFTGLLGLSVCINSGVCVPVPVPVVKQIFNKFKLAKAH